MPTETEVHYLYSLAEIYRKSAFGTLNLYNVLRASGLYNICLVCMTEPYFSRDTFRGISRQTNIPLTLQVKGVSIFILIGMIQGVAKLSRLKPSEQENLCLKLNKEQMSNALVCPNTHDSESTYFSCYCTINPELLHPKCIGVTWLIKQKTPICKFGQYRALPMHRISIRVTSNECQLVRKSLMISSGCINKT